MTAVIRFHLDYRAVLRENPITAAMKFPVSLKGVSPVEGVGRK